MRTVLATRIAVALVACAVIPAAAQAACSTAVTRASATASIPPDYLVLYQRWGGTYGVPWQLLAAVGSVESRHGRDPGAFVPHTRGVLGPMQFQAGSNKLARRTDSAGDQGFGGTWGRWRRSSGHPPYRMIDPDDEIAAAAAKIAADAGSEQLWTRALWRYNALHSYGKLVLRRAARLGMSSACGLLGGWTAPASAAPAQPAAPPPATPRGLLADDAIAFAPAAADDIAHGVADRRLVALLGWIAQRHRIVVTVIRTGHSRYVAGTHKVSNHWYGRAATISEVDGEAVAPGSRASAALWDELQTAPKALRPDEIGVALVGPGQPSLVHRARASRRRSTSASTPWAPTSR